MVVIVLAVFYRTALNARVEDEINVAAHKLCNVAVNGFCRVACRIGRNGIHACRVLFRRRRRAEHYFVAQLGKEREPERIVFVHVQNAR